MIQDNYLLTYCTNIHPAESWASVKEQLQRHTLSIKESLSPRNPFGIGLRLSDRASRELAGDPNERRIFRHWLRENHCFVFTMNGFPFGNFHGQTVKDLVHQPDWRHPERLKYTLRLFDLMVDWLPSEVEGGISTSPLSYKPWFDSDKQIDQAFQVSARQLAEVCAHLHILEQETGRTLHLDIEPEPDGLLENTAETIAFFEDYLFPVGGAYLCQKLGIQPEQAEVILRKHLRVCYDICHFALVYEDHAEALKAFRAAGIQIGKFQVSAALKIEWTEQDANVIRQALAPFAESTYLHQVVGRTAQQGLIHYPDLPPALLQAGIDNCEEWRIHYHVPVFLEKYQELHSTQSAIYDVLRVLRAEKAIHQLEVETYTWSVLPANLQFDLRESIVREMQWLIDALQSPLVTNGKKVYSGESIAVSR